jgi:hypothetical protein
LRRLGVDLYRGFFKKVARFDMAKAVDTDTGGFYSYGCSSNLLDVSNTSPLTWEYWKLIILQ